MATEILPVRRETSRVGGQERSRARVVPLRRPRQRELADDL